jgi:hypothetical protein
MGGLKSHTNLCKGPNYAIISNEESIKSRWETYFQDLNATTAERNTSLDNAHTNEIETKEEVEIDPPDILDT